MQTTTAEPLRNAGDFKTKPYTGKVQIPNNELKVGGDAPKGCENKKRIAEITKLYNKSKKK